MNAIMQDTAVPEAAARRLFVKLIHEGDALTLHTYRSAAGEPLYWRVRIKHPDGSKAMRPMCWDGAQYKASEPPAPDAGKPLYGLDALAAHPDADVYLVEGEGCADALNVLGLVAVTSGSCSSASTADWTPLQGRHVTIWPDHDAPGTQYAETVTAKLQALGCAVEWVAHEVVEALPEKGDCVDWLAAHPNATASDVGDLPTAATQAAATSPQGDAKAVVEAAIKAAAEDPEAAFTEEVITALVTIRDADRAEFIRLRRKIKSANRKITLKDLDELVGIEAHDEERETQTNADQLVELVKSCAELFHAPDGDGYATIEADKDDRTIRQTWPITSSGFGEWMAAAAWRELTLAVGDTLRKTAVTTLSGIAKFDGEERPVALRCAENPNGAGFIIDLADDDWRVVEVTPTGWRVLDESPVRFWRTKTMRPLPTPERDGDLSALWDFANLAQAERPLVLAWMLEAWRPSTAFPIAEFIGQQGSAKSSTQQTLRALIDPNDVPLRAAPKAVEDIFVAARNGWLASFNNLSHLSAPQQDALCGLATPGGFASRTLYTNDEETAWNTQRPVAINGISTLATAPDLLDRTVHLEPPRIETYKKDSDILEAFEVARPRILGALLDLFVATLAKLPHVTIAKPPRMADFAYLGEAMMQAQGNEPGAFMALYGRNREQSAMRALDASPVAEAVMSLVDRTGAWTGTYKDLLARLADFQHDGDAWPKSARGLADTLRRTAPPLRMAGYLVTEDGHRQRDGYHVTLKIGEKSNPERRSQSSQRSQTAPECEHRELGEHVYGLQDLPNARVSPPHSSSQTVGYSGGEL